MRIISGSFKGKKIFEPRDNKTRPLKDLTKESIFNLINHSNKLKINLINSKILDLFSGVGSFGLECISRGVNKVVFVENYISVLRVLKKNLNNLESVKNYQIIEKNIYDKNIFLDFNEQFNIIFLDPPYKDKNVNEILKRIEEKKLLHDNGVIILHRHKNETNLIPTNFKIIEERKYGISKIIFTSYLE